MSAEMNDLVQNNPLEPEDNPVLQGNFAPVEGEQTFTKLEVIGQLPTELCGTLLRNGPNPVNPRTQSPLVHRRRNAPRHPIRQRTRRVLSQPLGTNRKPGRQDRTQISTSVRSGIDGTGVR